MQLAILWPMENFQSIQNEEARRKKYHIFIALIKYKP